MNGNEIVQHLLVILITAILIGVIFFINHRHGKENQREMAQWAAANRWTHQPIREPLASGDRFISPGWTLEALSRSHGKETAPGSSDVAMSTIWRAALPTAALPGGTLLIGPSAAAVDRGPMGDALARQAMHLFLGEDAAGVVKVAVGSGPFQRAYAIWARDPEQAQRLLTSDIEATLLAWPGKKPVIKHTSEGLSIELQGVHLEKPDEIQRLIHLGEAVLARLESR